MSDPVAEAAVARAEALLSIERWTEALEMVARGFDPTSERCWFVRAYALDI